jgi:hypothetical protein
VPAIRDEVSDERRVMPQVRCQEDEPAAGLKNAVDFSEYRARRRYVLEYAI